ncbi:hypothetical protein Ndes2437B_g04698 [Nannochloris sp. 'desiccata']
MWQPKQHSTGALLADSFLLTQSPQKSLQDEQHTRGNFIFLSLCAKLVEFPKATRSKQAFYKPPCTASLFIQLPHYQH